MSSTSPHPIGRIELLVAEIERSSDAAPRAAARELVATLLAWHRAAIGALAAAVPPGELARLAREDDALEGILALHEIEVPDARPKKKVSLPIATPHRCELCNTEVPGDHRHVLDERTQRLVCVCAGCAATRAESRGLVALERPVRDVSSIDLSESDWAALEVPVRLVFFTPDARSAIARYPGPAGAIEARVPDVAWASLVAKAPELASIEPGVDALLVHHVRGAKDAFVLSIEECFRLTGAVRAAWTGIGGGDAKDAAIASFFAELRTRATAPAGGLP